MIKFKTTFSPAEAKQVFELATGTYALYIEGDGMDGWFHKACYIMPEVANMQMSYWIVKAAYALVLEFYAHHKIG